VTALSVPNLVCPAGSLNFNLEQAREGVLYAH